MPFTFERETKNYWVYNQDDGINKLYLPKVSTYRPTHIEVLWHEVTHTVTTCTQTY